MLYHLSSYSVSLVRMLAEVSMASQSCRSVSQDSVLAHCSEWFCGANRALFRNAAKFAYANGNVLKKNQHFQVSQVVKLMLKYNLIFTNFISLRSEKNQQQYLKYKNGIYMYSQAT